MKARVEVTYVVDLEIGELPAHVVQSILEADDGWSIFEANGQVEVESVEVKAL